MAGELPSGFTLDAAQTTPSGRTRVTVSPAQPGLPSGFTLDAPTGAKVTTVDAPEPGMVEDMLKSLAGGVGRGAAGLAGLPGEVAELGARGIDYATRKVGGALGVDVQPREARAPTYGVADARRGLERFTGPLYEPQTTAGDYANTLGEFAAAAPMLGGGLISKTIQTVVPALASETAGQATKGMAAEPWARLGGGLAGGVGASLLMRPGNAANSIRQQLPPDVTPQMVTQAERLMADASARGITLSVPEALSQVAGRPILQDAMRHLEASPQTAGRMAEFFGQRPAQVEQAARREFDNIAPINQQPQSIGPQVGRAAEQYGNDVRGAINTATEPLYAAASPQRMDPATFARIQGAPGWTEARNAVRNDPQLNRAVAGQPDDSIGFLNEVKKYLDNAAENAGAPINQQRNMQRSAGYGQDATTVRTAAEQASSEYAQALATQSWARENILQPILDGPIGKLANRDLTTRQAIDALFPRNPLANSEQVITEAVSALAQRSPRVTRDLVRAHAEGAFNEAARSLQGGPSQMAGANFAKAIAGNPQQRTNLQAAVEAGVPNGRDVWAGFERFLEIAQATGNRAPIGSRTAYNQQLIESGSAGGLALDATRTAANPLRGAQALVERYERWKLGQNLNGLADILTNPAAANQLRAIARMPANSSRSVEVANRLAVQYGASRD